MVTIYRKTVTDAYGDRGIQYRSHRRLFSGEIYGEIWPNDGQYVATDGDDKIVCVADELAAAETKLLALQDVKGDIQDV